MRKKSEEKKNISPFKTLYCQSGHKRNNHATYNWTKSGQKRQQKDQEFNPLCNQALSSCHVLLWFFLGHWDHQPQTKMAEKYNRKKVNFYHRVSNKTWSQQFNERSKLYKISSASSFYSQSNSAYKRKKKARQNIQFMHSTKRLLFLPRLITLN